MFPATLESDRLTFERLSRENVDVHALYEIFGANHNAEKVFEYVDSNPHKTIKETVARVERAEERFEDGEGAQYVVRPKSTEDHGGELAGIAGLYPKWDRRCATLGIILDEPFWGNGYSVERAELFIEIIFERLDLELVAVKYIDGNERSNRAIEKYIERFDGQYDGLLRNWLAVENEVFDCHRYTISKEQYEGAIRE